MAEERRLVTVVFADVVGSTSLGERLDPEDLRLLLGRFYEIARDVVADHGGVLEKFIGDAALAIFGAPRAHDDDPRRALSAALELRDRVRSDAELQGQLPIRIGINTGEVIAAAGGADPSGRDFIVTGDAVNVAARLQQAARPWAVLVGERTVAAAGTAFRYGARVSVDARGKRDPVWARPLRGATPSGATRRTPLYGRETELEQLELAARRAFGEHRPFLVTLIAPPGIGKTHLVESFVDRLPSIEPSARVGIARCLPYGQRLTYWPLRSLLADLASPEGTVPGLPAIRAWLSDLDCPEPEGTAELLAATVGSTELEASDSGAVYGAWQRALAAAASRAPLVLVFEDLHWASDSFLTLVEYVMQPHGNGRVLTIALARPELLDRRPQWGAGRLNSLNASLEPLAPPAMRRLVGALLGDPSPRLLEAVVRRAEGNPFFAEEMVRSLVERGGGAADAAGEDALLGGLPDTVQATVMSRLDLLDPADRHLLQVGAVLGREFRAAEVAALSEPMAPEAVRDSLQRSVERDLLQPVAGGALAFRHVLIRDGAYQALPRGERARIHAAAAEMLERGAEGQEEAASELIAYHYREAATAPSRMVAERARGDELRRKAVEWLTRAADQAIGVAASIEAANHLRAALELAEPEAQADLWRALGDVHLDEESAADAYTRALELAQAKGLSADRQLGLIADLLLVHARSMGGTTLSSRERIPGLVARGSELVGASGDEEVTARFEIALGFVPFSTHRGGTVPAEAAEEARTHASAGLEAAERLGDPNLLSMALDAMSAVAITQRRWDEVRDLASRRLQLADRLAPIEVVDAYATAAWAACALGSIREAETITAAGLARVRPGQAPTFVLHLLAWRIYALTLLGRWDEATDAGDRAEETWSAIGRGPSHFAGRGFLAAFDVASARRDVRRQQLLRTAVETIWADDPRTLEVMHAYLDAHGSELHAYLAGQGVEPDRAEGDPAAMAIWRPETFERVLSLCADLRQLPPVAVLEQIREACAGSRLAMTEIQARRALALASGDASELAEVLTRCEAAGAEPTIARLRCEIGQLTADEDLLARGMHQLERLGDLDQLERVRARHAEAS
ncbi:MAG TPA: adenylate/guanylate cyclase domain-containing protein [Candidatus Limnocylindria bacterium]|nr:adenylate/guanylate cyclase domain-containing protein [Candidatus Limnocylindria bacterium]